MAKISVNPQRKLREGTSKQRCFCVFGAAKPYYLKHFFNNGRQISQFASRISIYELTFLYV